MAKLAAGLLLLALVSSTSAACPADSHYDERFGKCYKLVASPSDFMSAEISCRSIGGNLVAIGNAYENNYVAGMGTHFTSFWIGGDLLMASDWTWTSGSNGTYSNFAPGQPSDPSIYQCAAVRDGDHLWTKELCSTRKPYICQIDPGASPVGNGCSTPSYPMTTAYPATASPSGCSGGYCSSGYTLNRDACKCYKFVNNATTYNNATAQCGSENATLPFIRNAAENIFLSNYVKNQPNAFYDPWIGAYCNSTSVSSCRWADGSSLTYSNFAPGQPKDSDAVFLDMWTTMWHSFPDDDYFTSNFVCEKAAYRNSVVPKFQSRLNPRNTHRASNINNV